eukprot:3934335-Rhodomonas_salina.3
MPSEVAKDSLGWAPKLDSATTGAAGEQQSKPKPINFPHKFVMAPMVGQSDLAFRLLCLRYGASVVYTEMLYSDRILNDPG